MTFDALLNPQDPTAYAPHLKQGVIVGCVLGIVTNVNDPERIGRVKVKADTIDPHNDLPNGLDGWIPLTESFTANAVPGGSHRLIKEGTQVVLLPILGRSNNWIVIDCVASRVDRPHPDFNRAENTYGSATPNGVINARNDTDLSRIESYPHGAIDAVSGEGNRTLETEAGARLQLTRAGNAQVGNNEAFVNLDPEGAVLQRSKAGAQVLLKASGEVAIENANDALLELKETQSLLSGPPHPISRLLKQAEAFLGGHLGQARQLLAGLSSLADELGLPLGAEFLEGAIAEAGEVLGQLQAGLGASLPGGLRALGQLQSFDPAQLGALLLPQVEALGPIAPVLSQIQNLVAQDLSGGELARAALGLLSPQRSTALPSAEMSSAKLLLSAVDVEALDVEALGSLLEGLSYDPRLQTEALVEVLAPDAGANHLFRLGLEEAVFSLEELLAPVRPPEQDAREAVPIDPAVARRQQVDAIAKTLPAPLRSRVSTAQIEAIAETKDTTASPMAQLLGTIQQGLIGQTLGPLQQAVPLVEALAPIGELVAAVRSGDFDTLSEQAAALAQSIPGFEGLQGLLEGGDIQDKIQELLRGALLPLVEQLSPLVAQALEALLQLGQALPREKGVVLQLQADFGELTDPDRKNRLFVDRSEAALEGGELLAGARPNRLFAGVKRAGIKTPFGKLSLGLGGGKLFSQGAMAMLNQSAGLLLHEDGKASLSSLAGVETDEDGEAVWRNERARVLVDGASVRLQSLEGEREVSIDPDGIRIDGVLIDNILERLVALEGAVAALQAAGAIAGNQAV